MQDKDQKLIWESYKETLDEGTDGGTSDLTEREKFKLAADAAKKGKGPLADKESEEDDVKEESSSLRDPKTKLIYMIRQLESLMPEADVGWNVKNGDFTGATPEYAGKSIGKTYDRSWSGLEEYLTDIWENEQFAQDQNLLGADWENTTSKYSSGPSLYWFANDSRVDGQRDTATYVDRLLSLDAGISESEAFIKHYGEFVPPKELSDEQKSLFQQQTDVRLALYPKSQEITTRGTATADAVGYGKGRYMGD